jgi:PhnB protein
MSTQYPYARHGAGTVRPYLYGRRDLFDFVRRVFEAEEVERAESPEGAHVEVRIGDSVVVLELGESFKNATQSSIYVYVPDVDAAYQRALEMGATSLAAPEDKPYGDRNAGVKDSFGNTWWIGTHLGEG